MASGATRTYTVIQHVTTNLQTKGALDGYPTPGFRWVLHAGLFDGTTTSKGKVGTEPAETLRNQMPFLGGTPPSKAGQELGGMPCIDISWVGAK